MRDSVRTKSDNRGIDRAIAKKGTMRQYELTYLISDNVPEAELNKVTGKVGGYIRDLKGKILKEETWGRRKLAYPIKKMEFATYVTVNFDLPAENATEFERNIFLTGKIIRHLMIVKDFGEEALTLTEDDIANTEEIKEVLGGERVIESVEGETEASKDLMAVRENDISAEEAVVETEEKSEVEEVKEVKEVEEEIIKEVEEKEAEVKEEEPVEEKAPEEKKEAKKAKAEKKEAKKDNEADRLSKLDKELDDILGEEL